MLSYFMADDTMSVFEPPVRNSGIVGGVAAWATVYNVPYIPPEPFRRLQLCMQSICRFNIASYSCQRPYMHPRLKSSARTLPGGQRL